MAKVRVTVYKKRGTPFVPPRCVYITTDDSESNVERFRADVRAQLGLSEPCVLLNNDKVISADEENYY